MSNNDDRKLVQKCIEGDVEAWNEFVERFSGLIYWAIKRKLNKHDSAYLQSEAEDIYQRIFASIWEKKSLIGVSERGNIAPWLVVLASNFTIDLIRRKRLEEGFLRNSFESEAKSQYRDTPVLLKENKRLLEEAMKSLNGKEKSCLELNYIAGKKHREIAEIFNISINSVSTIIARAKDKIKKYIESKNK